MTGDASDLAFGGTETSASRTTPSTVHSRRANESAAPAPKHEKSKKQRKSETRFGRILFMGPIHRLQSRSALSPELHAARSDGRKFPTALVHWQRGSVTGLLLEFPLLLWRRGPGRGGRLYRNFSVTILAVGTAGRRCFRPGRSFVGHKLGWLPGQTPMLVEQRSPRKTDGFSNR